MVQNLFASFPFRSMENCNTHENENAIEMEWHAMEAVESLIRTQITYGYAYKYPEKYSHTHTPTRSNKIRTNNHMSSSVCGNVCVYIAMLRLSHKARFHIQLDYYLWHFLCADMI